MDIPEIRARNLAHVLDNVLHNRGITKNKDAAQAMGGLGSSYLSQLKGGKKIGDDTARKIEAALHWKHGMFDVPQWHTLGVKEDIADYPDPNIALTPREQALLANYRASDERTKNVVDAAAAAAAEPIASHKAKTA